MKRVDPYSRAAGHPSAAQPDPDADGASPDAAAEPPELRARYEDLARENEALRRANEQLVREREGYRQRDDALTIACATLDPTGNVIEGNQALATLLHLDAGAIAGVNLESAIAVPQHVQRFRDHLVAVFRSQAAHGCELWLRRPDGGVTRVRLESRAQFDAEPARCRSVMLEVSMVAGPDQPGLVLDRQSSPPLRGAQASQDGSGSALAAAARATPATILVVEDESLVRKAVEHYLNAAGYRVISAIDGEDALEHSQQHGGPIDLILTDLSLPNGATGPEIAQRIQQRWPYAGVLYMTACPPQLLARRGFSAQVGATLEKPFSKAALLARVSETLAQAAARVPANDSAEDASPRPNDG